MQISCSIRAQEICFRKEMQIHSQNHTKLVIRGSTAQTLVTTQSSKYRKQRVQNLQLFIGCTCTGNNFNLAFIPTPSSLSLHGQQQLTFAYIESRLDRPSFACCANEGHSVEFRDVCSYFSHHHGAQKIIIPAHSPYMPSRGMD